MIKVVGIRFRKAGKIYYFDPGTFDIEPGQHVIVETVRGIEYGSVVLGNREIAEDDVVQPLKKVIRITTEDDDGLEVKNKAKEREAFEVCIKKIRKHELDMKLIDCEYTFDNNKLLFYFTADGRIDFRELVKDLAAVFKTRIELRQIGVRDETKMIGSIGICGRTLCCHAHLADFHPVSIKMAKEQNLSLNPTKISGVCGRLMCCLKYEEETYAMLNKELPRIGESVIVKETGLRGEVIKTNIIRQRVKLVIRKPEGDVEIVEMKLEELELKGSKKRKDQAPERKEVVETKKVETVDKEEKTEQNSKVNAQNSGQNKKRFDKNRKPNRGNQNKSNQNRNSANKDNANKDNPNKSNVNKNNANKDNRNKSNANKNNQNKNNQNKNNQKPKDNSSENKGTKNPNQKHQGNKRNQRNRRPSNQNKQGQPKPKEES